MIELFRRLFRVGDVVEPLHPTVNEPYDVEWVVKHASFYHKEIVMIKGVLVGLNASESNCSGNPSGRPHLALAQNRSANFNRPPGIDRLYANYVDGHLEECIYVDYVDLMQILLESGGQCFLGVPGFMQQAIVMGEFDNAEIKDRDIPRLRLHSIRSIIMPSVARKASSGAVGNGKGGSGDSKGLVVVSPGILIAGDLRP
jgi:hypothetical protein